MNIFIELAMVLFFAKVGGYLAKKILNISDIGEILVGAILGPGMLALFQPDVFFQHFADIGIVMLMFLIGLKFNVKAFEKFLEGGILIAIFGAFVPFFAGLLLAFSVLGLGIEASFVLATIFMTTSITATVSVLDDAKQLRTPIGCTIMDAAVADDLFGISMLTLVLSIIGTETPSLFHFGFFGLAIILFFAAILMVGPAISRFALNFGKHLDLRIKEGHLSMILIALFAMTFVAHTIGLSIIIGAFLAGVIFDKRHIKGIEHEIFSMTYGFFIPIFYVYLGSFMLPSAIVSHWWMVLLIVSIALAGKFVGAFLGSMLSRNSIQNSAIISVGMMGRGEVALVIALLARNLNIITPEIYTVIVSSIVVTVIIAPLLLRLTINRFKQ